MSRPDGYLVPGQLSADAVVAEVARGFRVTTDDILGDSRARHIVVARACAMAVIRRYTDWSWPTIGEYFARHEQTVRHNVANVMRDPDLTRGVDLVIEELLPAPRLFAVPKDPRQEAV